MRAFHELIFDRQMEGTGDYYPQEPWMIPLGYVERIKFMIVADIAQGTTPSLAVVFYETPDLTFNSLNQTATVSTSLSTTDSTIWSIGYTGDDAPISKYIYLKLTLAGTNPKSHVRVWATGHAAQPLPPDPSPPKTVGEEIERARTLARAVKEPFEELGLVSPKMWLV